jgi:hypothetical protein
MCFAGGVDRLLARSGVPTPGGVRARAAIEDRTRKYFRGVRGRTIIQDRTLANLFPEREMHNRAFLAAGPAVEGIGKGQAEQ